MTPPRDAWQRRRGRPRHGRAGAAGFVGCLAVVAIVIVGLVAAFATWVAGAGATCGQASETSPLARGSCTPSPCLFS